MTSKAYAALVEGMDDNWPCRCGGCVWTGLAKDTLDIGECELTPGDPSPVGRCPDCGSIAYVLGSVYSGTAHTSGDHWLNDYQRALLTSFSDGEFAHLLDCPNGPTFDTALDECGNTLLRFLVRETGQSEGCTSLGDALQRLANVQDDVHLAYDIVADLSRVQHGLRSTARFREVSVCMDDSSECFRAFCNGDTYNGGVISYFTRNEAIRLAKFQGELVFDDRMNAFIWRPHDGTDADCQTYVAERIEVEGSSIEVYGIGAGSWCWYPQ